MDITGCSWELGALLDFSPPRNGSPTALTEHPECDGRRAVAVAAALRQALEGAGVGAADGREAQRRLRALAQPPAVPVPAEGGRPRVARHLAAQGDGFPLPHLRRGLDQDSGSCRREGRGWGKLCCGTFAPRCGSACANPPHATALQRTDPGSPRTRGHGAGEVVAASWDVPS